MSKLDESQFHNQADATLQRLIEALEEALGDGAEVELHGGILTIDVPGRGQYLLNKHAPNRQLWLSSPLSGAAHFHWNAGSGWVGTRGEGALTALLAQELSDVAAGEVQLA